MQASEVNLDRPCANQRAERHPREFVMGRLVHEHDRQDRGAARLMDIRDRGLDRVTRRDDVVDNQDFQGRDLDRKSTRLNSSHGYISYAVFCLKKKKKYLVPHSSPPYIV